MYADRSDLVLRYGENEISQLERGLAGGESVNSYIEDASDKSVFLRDVRDLDLNLLKFLNQNKRSAFLSVCTCEKLSTFQLVINYIIKILGLDRYTK